MEIWLIIFKERFSSSQCGFAWCCPGTFLSSLWCSLRLLYLFFRFHHECWNVTVPPKIKDLPGSMDVVAGKPLVVECISEGFPRPRIFWSGPSVSEAVNELGLLKITSVGNEHAGNHTCTASNDAGTDSRAVELHVLSEYSLQWNSWLNTTTRWGSWPQNAAQNYVLRFVTYRHLN